MRLERFQVGDELVKLGRKLNMLVDYCKAITPKSGENTRIRQTHAGAYISADRSPGGGGCGGGASTYDGPFAITDNGNDTLNISAGKVINGTTVSSIAAATNESVSGKTYLSIEIWYNAAWKSDYLAGAAYPTQAVKTDGGTDYPCFRRLIAEKVDGTWKQRFNDSEIVNPNIAD